MTAPLTASDCLAELELLSATQSRDPGQRQDALRRVTDLFMLTSERQREDDSTVFGAVMGRLAGDVGEESRAELSARIAERPTTSRDLACQLANDTITVARPILEHAVNLTSEDLVQVARNQSQEHMLAIAQRIDLTPPVTEVLAESGDAPVLRAVAGNQHARFSETGLQTIVRRASSDLDTNEALSERADISGGLRDTLRENVTRACESELAEHGLDVSLSEIAGPGAPDPAAPLPKVRFKKEADQLHRQGVLREDTIVRFAKSGAKSSTTYAISLLSGLGTRVVERCLFQGSPVAVAILLKALGFAKRTVLDLMQLRGVGEATPLDFPKQTSQIFDAIDELLAQRIIRFLKIRLSA